MSRSAPRRWDVDEENSADHEGSGALLTTSDLVTTLQSSSCRHPMICEPPQLASRRGPPSIEPQTSLAMSDWSFNGSADSRVPLSSLAMDVREFSPRTTKGAVEHGYKVSSVVSEGFDGNQFDSNHLDGRQGSENYKTIRTFRTDYKIEPSNHRQHQLQRYEKQKQYHRQMQQEDGGGDSLTSQLYRRTSNNNTMDYGFYAQEERAREPLNDMSSVDPPQCIASNMPNAGSSSFGLRFNGLTKDVGTREIRNRHYNAFAPPSTNSPEFGPRIDDMPLEPATLNIYPDENDPFTATVCMSRQREYAQAPVPSRQRVHHQMTRRFQYSERLNEDEMMMTGKRSFQDSDLPRDRHGTESRALYEELVRAPTSAGISQNNGYENLSPSDPGAGIVDPPSSLQRSNRSIMHQKDKRSRSDNPLIHDPAKAPTQQAAKAKTGIAKTFSGASTTSPLSGNEGEERSKRRCGRKSMNYSSEQKRERNRAAVKKCRQRQALKLEYLQHKAESLAAENQALSEMLVKNTELAEEHRISLKRGIQMDILLKIKEIFTQSLPKDFVLDAGSIWDLNSVLAVSMPSRCYYGIESIKDFWRTSLRMRNKGKIRSFWAWLFRLPPGDRFLEFDIQSFSPTSSLYFVSWTTKSTPPLAGTMVILFGNGHRVTLHVECFGWLIWRYLLTNEPFPEASIE
ncbi:unnamed protein product [Peronospora belbahrii]|uniref:BZIP domain-containing protein n=1 Tax=Peronospora belbahrii TaxID=622444 RepID=A0ABN8CLD5_9STRA|nr:unnamed protein product [Peronospora belbahrii]